MVRKIALLTLVAALVVGLSGCVLRRAEESEARTESRDVEAFDEVEFTGYGTLKIEQGPDYAVEVSGPGDEIDRLKTEVRGDTLVIGQEERFEFWLFGWGTREVEVRMTVPDLSKVQVSGAGDVNIDGLETESFEFRLSGAGQLTGRDLDLGELVVEMSGAGRAELSGAADSQEIVISGAGEYDAADLETRDTRIDMSGAGTATVWAEDTLDVKASGAGSVNYYGNPDVDSDVSGAGTLDDRGDR